MARATHLRGPTRVCSLRGGGLHQTGRGLGKLDVGPGPHRPWARALGSGGVFWVGALVPPLPVPAGSSPRKGGPVLHRALAWTGLGLPSLSFLGPCNGSIAQRVWMGGGSQLPSQSLPWPCLRLERTATPAPEPACGEGPAEAPGWAGLGLPGEQAPPGRSRLPPPRSPGPRPAHAQLFNFAVARNNRVLCIYYRCGEIGPPPAAPHIQALTKLLQSTQPAIIHSPAVINEPGAACHIPPGPDNG